MADGHDANDGDGGESAGRVPWASRAVWEAAGFLRFLAAHSIERRDLVGPSDGAASRFFRMKKTQRRDVETNKETEGDDTSDGGSSGSLPQQERALLASIRCDLEAEGVKDPAPVPVAWLPGFFALPASAPLARIGAYRDGQIYGMDCASGFAVSLLDIRPGDHVLDLCCAPGAKLTMIADLLELRGSVTGVDFSRQRIGACKQLVHKYQLIQPSLASTGADATDPNVLSGWRCRLFHADGRTFDVGPKTVCADSGCIEVVLDTDEIVARGPRGFTRKRKNKSARARDRKRQKTVVVTSEALYDKVLVDAECTHDGSIRHLQKLQTREQWKSYVDDHLNDHEVERILLLQRELIRNGFRLLAPGGTMIYSTCSLSVRQNEEILSSFLEEMPQAALDPINCDGIPCQEGRVLGTVRFTPSNHTSGLFIAKIRKLTTLGGASNPSSDTCTDSTCAE